MIQRANIGKPITYVRVLTRDGRNSDLVAAYTPRERGTVEQSGSICELHRPESLSEVARGTCTLLCEFGRATLLDVSEVLLESARIRAGALQSLLHTMRDDLGDRLEWVRLEDVLARIHGYRSRVSITKHLPSPLHEFRGSLDLVSGRNTRRSSELLER